MNWIEIVVKVWLIVGLTIGIRQLLIEWFDDALPSGRYAWLEVALFLLFACLFWPTILLWPYEGDHNG